jgi:hypothetical protein
MIEHLKTCFENAQLDKSKCSSEILRIDGMSGRRTRHFYNNLLTLPDARYLEIGTWKGSSVCSAMFENSADVVCVDNWTEFSGPKNEFLTNFNKFKGNNTAKFIEQDCFSIDVTTLPRFNIYLYDGDHKEESHYKALTHYIDCMDDTFIYVVDDWNWKSVRDGTQRAIADLNLKILYEIDHRTTNNDTHPVFRSAQQVLWHNGIYAAVLLKH